MKQRVRDLKEHGDKEFSKRSSALNLWQTIAENFYPERADFTTTRVLGDEFASHLMSGRPVMARRDLANALSSMLRPRASKWYHVRTADDQVNDQQAAREWLDWATDRMVREMYDPAAQFVRTTKQADNDFTAFGQCVLTVERDRDRNGVLYRSWHLRDVAWCENAKLVVDTIHRNWSLAARSLVRLFPKTVARQVSEAAKKEPYRDIKARHIVIPADEYDYDYKAKGAIKRDHPFMSIYIDMENDTILEETPVATNDYVIPRWVTVAGFQYAYSPAVVVALPDARMLQQIGLTLLEAGQKAVDPPMKAVGEVIQGGVNTYAGGVTWVDSDYDEATGKALEPMQIDTRGLNWGVAREQQCAAMIAEAFYLNKLTLPDLPGDMTAYEVQRRVEEYIRQALPLFEPIETEYNAAVCEKTFDHMLLMGKFGNPADMPEELSGQDVRFQFESPLQAATDRAKSNAFMQAGQLLAQAMQLDPSIRHDVDVDKGFRDAFLGAGAPSDWLRDEREAQKLKDAERQQQAQAAQAQNQLNTVAQVSDVAARAGAAAQEVQAAQQPGRAA